MSPLFVSIDYWDLTQQMLSINCLPIREKPHNGSNQRRQIVLNSVQVTCERTLQLSCWTVDHSLF